jgi:N-acetylneuraminic acid mutarotase
MVNKRLIQVTTLLLLLMSGVWILRQPVHLKPEPVARVTALRALTTGSQVGQAGEVGATGQTILYEPVSPMVVDFTAVDPNTPHTDGMHERWLRGELDLDEMESILSAVEIAALQEAAMRSGPTAGVQLATSGPGLRAPTPGGVNFDSIDYTQAGGSVPPDPEMAVGPNHIIVVVNVAVAIYNKAGTALLGPVAAGALYSHPSCVSGLYDPNVLYDEEADRYIIAFDKGAFSASGGYCLLASLTGDPMGLWKEYFFPLNGAGGWLDYPHAGVGDNHIFMGGNIFSFGGSFVEGRIYAFNKTDLYAGNAVTAVAQGLTSALDTPQPINLHGVSTGSWPNWGEKHYFMAQPYDGVSYRLLEWDTATLTNRGNITVGTGLLPVQVVQSGGSNIQANDWRPLDFEYRNGYGWMTATNGCNPGGGTVNCILWAQVDLSGPTAALGPAGSGVYGSSGDHRFFPDLAVNHCDDMVVGYTKSNAGMFPSVWVTGRESDDTAGQLQAEVQLKAGEIAYTAFDSVPRRWGDYTGMTIDPDGLTFWYLGEYSKNTGTTNGRWGNYIGSFTYPSCVLDVSISLAKTVGTDPSTCAATDTITVDLDTDVTYCYTVTNDGDTTLNLHNLFDSDLGELLDAFPYPLLPGATTFITQTTNIVTTTTNTAVWAAYNANFSYTFDDSAPYNFIDISASGTALNLSDDGEANVTMPFPFIYYGVTSNLTRIGNNGGIRFATTTGDVGATNAALPNAAHPLTIVPFWDDLDDETGNVYYDTLGTAPNRMFIVQWHERPHFPGPGVGNVTFQAILFEGTNEILFQYADLDFGDPAFDYGASATVGLNKDSVDAVQYSFNSAVLTDGMAILWTPTNLATAVDSATVHVLIPEITVTPDSFDLTLVLGQSATVPMTVANPGSGSLNFQIYEMEGNNVPDSQNGYGISMIGPEQSQSPENDNGSTVLSGPSVGTRGSFAASALTDPWVTISPVPQAVSRPAGAVVDGLLYVVGGESSGGDRFGQVQIYDPATDLWDNISAPTMPTPVSNLCAVAIDDQIYVPGGWSGTVVETALQVFDTTTNSWQTIITDPLPDARYGSGCASHDGKLYLFGGWDGAAATGTAWVYDPAAGAGARWTTLADAPFTGVYGAALSVNGLIFYGGVSDNASGNFAHVAAYDPVADDWTPYPSLQTPRGGAGMWAIRDTLYIGGGGWSSYLTTVEAYDTSLDAGGSWQFTNALNQGRRTFAYATDPVNGHLYAAAGWAGAFLTHAEKSDFLVFTDVPWLSQQPMAGTVAAGDTAVVDVTLDAGLPITQTGQYYATMVIINNSADSPIMVPVTMTVIAPVYGVALSGNQATSGDAGTTVTYTIQITNTGNVSDTFDLTAVGGTWATVLDSSVTLAAGASASVTVQVLIPASAADGGSNVVTITAVSQGDPTESDSLTLTTTAVVPIRYIYLPIIFRP